MNQPAVTPEPWESFSPPPMTMIPPAPQALTNPPLLHWSPQPRAAAYRVEMSGRDWRVEATARGNFFMPDERVPTGTFRAVVTPLAADGAPAGPAATLDHHVPETAWDAPPPRLAPPASVAFGQLLATTDELAAIRAATGGRAALRDALLAAAGETDPLLDHPGPLREPARYPGGVWDFDLWHRGNSYCFAIENTILACSLSWLLTGNAAHRDRARDLMLQVAPWDPVGATGVWENDHSAQALLHALALGFDAQRGHLSPDDADTIARAIATRAADIHGLLNPFLAKNLSCGPMNNPDNNHPWFVASAMGIAGLALADRHPGAHGWADWALHLYWGNFLPRGSRTGAWHEGVDYWSYTLFFVFHLADALRNAGGADLYAHPWLRATGAFKAACHPPVGAWVPFGDCKHRPPGAFDRIIMTRLASGCGDAVADRYARAVDAPVDTARYLFHAVLWEGGAAGEGADAPVPETTATHHYDDIGWVVDTAHADDAENQQLFAFRCGPACPHAHADQNSLVLCAGGDRLLWDAGYYDSYLSPHHRDYSRLSVAHNTILADGEGQLPAVRGVDGRITRFEPAADGRPLVVEGDCGNPLVYGGRLTRFVRRAEYRRGASLVVADDIAAAPARRLSFLLHSAFPIAWDAAESTLTIRGARWMLTARLVSEHPVEAVVSTHFPVDPGVVSHVLDDDTAYPPQGHLELRTAHPVETWRPRLEATLTRL